MGEEETPAHVLIFPLPLQGPVNSMLKLAELLCFNDLHVTFLVTDHIHSRLQRHSNIKTRFEAYPGFRIRTISDGLPENHPRGDRFLELFDSLRRNTKPLFKEMLASGSCRVSCIVSDGIMGFSGDVASEVGIPFFYVRTISAACLWVFFCLPKLIQAGEIPFQGDDLDVTIHSIPGMESYLRRRDLPGFFRSGDITDPHIQFYITEGEENPRARGLILNTFDELEAPILSQIRKTCPNIYTIGPLHAHLKAKLADQVPSSSSSTPPFSNSLWEEDRTCITWLDAQLPKSVIYVSFGSLAVTTNEQLMEVWHGLLNSGHRFLWVIRPDSVKDSDKLTAEFSEGMRERGCIVGWAPQEEVLSHCAVGGFLTHSGWNSTLESVYEGVPMICWPYFLDQQVNSRLVEEWKLGLDMKDICSQAIIEKSVREVMEIRKQEFQQRAGDMANAAQNCLREGGSSYRNLDRLIQDIQSIVVSDLGRFKSPIFYLS